MSEKEHWIEFKEGLPSKSGKTKTWFVVSTLGDARLGTVSWHGPWRKYGFSPDRTFWTIFEEVCLRDIADFVEQKTKEHKEKNEGNRPRA